MHKTDQSAKLHQARIQLSHLSLPKKAHPPTILTNPVSKVRQPKEQ